jgi:hypothetical protein
VPQALKLPLKVEWVSADTSSEWVLTGTPMNLHETLTYRRFNAHHVRVPLRVVRWGRPSVPTLMASNRRHLTLLLLIAVLGALLLLPSGALAAGCDTGEMIDAAVNNRPIATHTVACYQQALAAAPADSDSYDPELRANLITAMNRDGDIAAGVSGKSRLLQSAAATPAAAVGVRGPVANLLEAIGPEHVDQVPVPVVALAIGSALLLLAGLGTSLSRVRQRRLSR